MRRTLLAAALPLAMFALTNSADAQRGERLRERLRAGRPAAELVVPPSVQVHRDLAYGVHPSQRLDVYAPQSVRGAPIVLLVHGGAWRFGDKGGADLIQNKLNHWSAKGYVLASINYRMLPLADPLEQARDVARALAFAQTHAAEWGGDPTRLVLVGHSAGAHLVALLASDPAFAQALGARPWRATVSLDGAAMDIPALMAGEHFPLHDEAFGADPAFWRAVSPAHRLKGARAPILAVCSTLRSIRCPQAEAFARKAGSGVEVMPVPLTHAQINHELGGPGEYTAKVDAFIEKALPPQSVRP